MEEYKIVLLTLATLSGLGVILALILYFVAQKFKVVEDPRIDEVDELLPGANCGGCGYPGCRGFAEACVSTDNLDAFFCPVGGNDVMKQVAGVLGAEVADKEPQVAVVRCQGSPEHRKIVRDYDGPQSCAISHSLFGGTTNCANGCMGLGDCVEVCNFDAIHINPETLLPEVIEADCTGCGACIDACPRDIIELRNVGKKSRRIYVSCVNSDKGAPAKKACDVACIGCGKCVKICPFDAITLENNKAYIDYEKCKLCRKCVAECPTNAIVELNFPPRKPKAEKLAEKPAPKKEEVKAEKTPETAPKAEENKKNQLTNKRRKQHVEDLPKGGVHPAENKMAAGAEIQTPPLPKQVVIPIAQHIGAPAQPVVKRGDVVKTGSLIAKAGGFVSANIHSSVSGKVKKIDNILDTSGYKKQCIIIDVEGDEWEESIDRDPAIIKDMSATPEEIRNKVMDAGIVGLGGATFPTHVKLSVPEGKKVEYIVINAVECEPYLTADHRVMLEMPHQIMIGTSLLMKAIGVDKAIIGVENNKPDAIDLLRKTAQEYKGITVDALKVQYPQGGEKQLIKAVLDREVPSGGLPLDVGCVVQNVGTTIAVYEAVQKNKPLFERVVTVTGKSVKNPVNIMARIGTSADALIEAAGGLPEDTGKVVNGGPMMGKAISETDIPVTKGTSGILIFSKKESKRAKVHNCIRCARCTFVCPQGLEPFNLKNITGVSDWDKLEEEHVMDCIECGSCSYTCPAGVPLLDYIRLGKSTVSQIIRSRKN